MTLTLPRRLLIAGALCLLALIGLVISEARARAAGREVILAMEPIDPRSLLTGHYVQLNFSDFLAASDKCPNLTAPQFAASNSQKGWIALRKRGDRYVAVSSAPTRAPIEDLGEVFVRGNATCVEAIPATTGPNGFPGRPASVTMFLAVDRFHTSQHEAEAIEKAMRDRTTGEPRVLAILSIGADGTPRTKGLIVDGKRIELRMF